MIIHPIAQAVADRLLAALKAKRLARIDIDVITGACEVAAHFDDWSPEETHTMIDAVLRRVVEKA